MKQVILDSYIGEDTRITFIGWYYDDKKTMYDPQAVVMIGDDVWENLNEETQERIINEAWSKIAAEEEKEAAEIEARQEDMWERG